MSQRLRVVVGVNAVIVSGDRMLVLRRSVRAAQFGGRWDLPGGMVEPGETLETALKREIKEETGYVVRIRRAIASHSLRVSCSRRDLRYLPVRLRGPKRPQALTEGARSLPLDRSGARPRFEAPSASVTGGSSATFQEIRGALAAPPSRDGLHVPTGSVIGERRSLDEPGHELGS